jgi:hypothetical protein
LCGEEGRGVVVYLTVVVGAAIAAGRARRARMRDFMMASGIGFWKDQVVM